MKTIEWLKKHSTRAVLGLLMVLALAVRLVYLHLNPLVSRDGIHYILFTREWFAHGSAALPSFARMPPPLFCYLGRALMYLGIDAACGLGIINMFFGVATLIPAYLIGRTLYDDRKAGLWLAAFAAVAPPLVTFSCLKERECLYVFMLFWVVWLWTMVVREKQQMRSATGCGAAVIIAMYCRYEAIELLPFAILGLPLSVLIPSRQWKRSLQVLGCAAGGAVCALVVMLLLPGMPNIIRIFYNQFYAQCLGTSLNPL